MDEVFVKINGELHYLWRAIDHEGEVLECYVSKRRNKDEALKFLKKTMRKHEAPKQIVTDKLRSYGAALKVIQCSKLQETGTYLNNCCENSHLPFKRKKGRCKSLNLQKRDIFKQQRSNSLSEWRGLCAA